MSKVLKYTPQAISALLRKNGLRPERVFYGTTHKNRIEIKLYAPMDTFKARVRQLLTTTGYAFVESDGVCGGYYFTIPVVQAATCQNGQVGGLAEPNREGYRYPCGCPDCHARYPECRQPVGQGTQCVRERNHSGPHATEEGLRSLQAEGRA